MDILYLLSLNYHIYEPSFLYSLANIYFIIDDHLRDGGYIPKGFKEEASYIILLEFLHLMTEFMLSDNIFDLSSIEFRHYNNKINDSFRFQALS